MYWSDPNCKKEDIKYSRWFWILCHYVLTFPLYDEHNSFAVWETIKWLIGAIVLSQRKKKKWQNFGKKYILHFFAYNKCTQNYISFLDS